MTSLSMVAPTAGAAGTVTTEINGNAFRVTTSGGADVVLGCAADQITIGGTVPSPTMACSLVAEVVVIGDDAGQTVDARALDATATFPQEPRLAASTGGGVDVVRGTRSADIIRTGGDDDRYEMGGDDVAADDIDLGEGFDQLDATGTSGVDTITVSSTGAATTLAFDPGVASTALGVEVVNAEGGAGADTLTSAGVDGATELIGVVLDGGAGDDEVTGGGADTFVRGGSGTNELITLKGATIDTTSDTDQITLVAGTSDINDLDSPRSGGRTITSTGGEGNYFSLYLECDSVVRSRPVGSSVRQTASLCRPGQQLLPPAIGREIPVFNGSLPDRSLFDVVVAPGREEYSVRGDLSDLLDVTVPSGTFHVEEDGFGTTTVVTDSTSYPNVQASEIASISAHGPWTDQGQGLVHRATRDLLFRFPSATTVQQTGAKVTTGALSRPAFVSSLMRTDEYRGLDVDRVFVQYLRRGADPGGRTYWVNSIRNGKALWRFRAQLLGGNEYFTKAGGTNAAYVTASYTDALSRTPDPGGLAYWTNKLNNGADRGSVALQFLNSPEARRRRVDDQFLRFLDRYPTSTEQATWVAALPGATGEQDLIAFLAASSAYYARD